MRSQLQEIDFDQPRSRRMAQQEAVTVALSSSEAEYVSAAEAARDIAWLRRFLAHVGCAQPLPTTLFIDNQCTIGMANDDGVHHARRKHINVKHHYIRECIRVDKISSLDGSRPPRIWLTSSPSHFPLVNSKLIRDVIMGYKHTIPAMM